MAHDSKKMIALIIVTLANFITPFMASSINIALPTIGKEFAANAILLSWIPTSFLVTTAIFAVPFGRISDIFGMKKIFTYGMIIFTISSLLSALAPSAISLIFFRIIQGIGGAMIFVTAVAIIILVFPPKERGKVLGITISAVYIGLSLGPILGGFLTQNLGWRSLFYFTVPIGLIVLILTILKLKDEWAISKGEKLDLKGSIIYGFTILMVMSGFSMLPGNMGIIMIILGILGLITFITLETRIESPVLNLNLFKNTTFAFSNLAALINYSATFAVTFLLSLYLQYIKGLDAQTAGIILVSQPVLMALIAPFAGRLSDKIEPRIIASIGMAITTLGLFLFTFINQKTAFWYIVIALAILGIGFGLFSSPNTNAIMGSVKKRFYGVASAMVSTMRLIGQALSLGIVIMIFSLYIGSVQIAPSYYPNLLESTQIAFIIFTILCFIGIFASLAKRRNKIAL
jgi:EmrB/QacA subfamily drug resistance transporter